MARKQTTSGFTRPVSERDTSAYDAAIARVNGSAEEWEARAREAARRLGVAEDLPKRDRAMAIMRAFLKRGGVGAAYRKRERVPGEDDE